ncbi:helix-turn-helix domain-containing protein [Plantactinospora soyae]|uniref:Sugar diacid utilization regulator n=1 Tax=Plantactinospora soyae TaxID=1544732 RepID=A0A927QYA3_9ACTN|nr:helix-turn-helix domain-containing protein [Plantactinospora soyae]MBE1489000.1 sugar diacid utilization regulator [Plantactinospora soyae]
MSPESMDVADANRTQDLLTLARLSVRHDAVRAVLDWLGQRTGGVVFLIGAGGRTLVGPVGRQQPDPGVLRAASTAVSGLRERGATAAVLDRDHSSAIHVISLGGAAPDRGGTPRSVLFGAETPYLAVVGRPDQRYADLLADAARTLSLCWRLAEADRNRQRIATADAHGREAVLHLLMVGDVPPARRVASALRPPLPDALRVGVIECAGSQRYEIAAEIERALSGRAWVVPCPVRSNHLIALMPSESADRVGGRVDPADRIGRLITTRVARCRVGMSEQVALHNTATGYEQAFHALAVARATPEGYARFDRQSDLVPLTGADGYAWAHELLRPCLFHVPARRADPGAPELLGTLSSWLTFDRAASRHLKIHRNTLAGRLRLLNSLLGLDLFRIRDQSAAWLALRLRGTPDQMPPAGTPDRTPTAGAGSGHADGVGRGDAGTQGTAPPAGTLDRLLATPVVTSWARARLRPLERADRSAVRDGPAVNAHTLETVRIWLDSETNLATTSAVLGISPSATRKRLYRAEQALGRSLLDVPSVRHELWLAMRALDMLPA